MNQTFNFRFIIIDIYQQVGFCLFIGYTFFLLIEIDKQAAFIGTYLLHYIHCFFIQAKIILPLWIHMIHIQQNYILFLIILCYRNTYKYLDWMLKKEIVHLKQNKIMEYQWGSTRKQCLISQLTHRQHARYAELWMGTHKNGPSKLENNITLAQYLKERNIGDLPFLFKILCIEKALSIQLHPNKKQAERLFTEKPGIYPDDNQKPEMFYTLTEFQCFFGIISHQELEALLKKQPFSLLQTRDSFSIKKMIEQLCSIPVQKQKAMIDMLLSHIQQICPQRKQVLERIHTQFPYDVGILVSCLLKYKKLPPGVCFAIAAGVPHAYLKGQCFQIMKNSDNVIRLGLTPKLKDIPTLLDIMNETVGLDGINVEKIKDRYSWNGLTIDQIESQSNEAIEITIEYMSIGIIVEKKFICEEFQIQVDRGAVLFFTPGQYIVKGPFKIFIGSYSGS